MQIIQMETGLNGNHFPQQLTNEIANVVDLQQEILFSRPILDVWRNLSKTSGNGLMHFR